MNEKVLHTLEYNKILDQLTEYAFSADAKSRCQKLRPITDRAQIEQLQQQTSDALSRLFKYGSLSFSGVTDIRDSLKRLEIGGALSAIELLRCLLPLRVREAREGFCQITGRQRPAGRFPDRSFCRHRTSHTAVRRDPALYSLRGRDRR